MSELPIQKSFADLSLDSMEHAAQSVLDAKTKPPGSLGMLESWAIRYDFLIVIEKRTVCLMMMLITCRMIASEGLPRATLFGRTKYFEVDLAKSSV
jgi:hypothetical protein